MKQVTYALCGLMFLFNISFAGGAVVEARPGRGKELVGQETATSGKFDYSIRLLEMPLKGPAEPRSFAWFGLSSPDESKKALVIFINTPYGEEIKIGVEYQENGVRKYHKSVFNNVPMNHVLTGTLELRDGGLVIFEANGVRKELETNLGEVVQVMGASGAKVEFDAKGN